MIITNLFLTPRIRDLIRRSRTRAITGIRRLQYEEIVKAASSITARFFRGLRLTLSNTHVRHDSRTARIVVRTSAICLRLFAVRSGSFLYVRTRDASTNEDVVAIRCLTNLFVLRSTFCLVRVEYVGAPRVEVLRFCFLLRFYQDSERRLDFQRDLARRVAINVRWPKLRSSVGREGGFQVRRGVYAINLLRKVFHLRLCVMLWANACLRPNAILQRFFYHRMNAPLYRVRQVRFHRPRVAMSATAKVPA